MIKRVYEVDPECGGQIQVMSFIEPSQANVIEAILKHCGLRQSRSPRRPPVMHELVVELDASFSLDTPVEAYGLHEWTYVDINTFLVSS